MMKQKCIHGRISVFLLYCLTSIYASAVTLSTSEDDKYVVQIEISTAGTYRHNINGFVGNIDWGDGASSQYMQSVNHPEHIYESPGKYVITAKGKARQLDSNFASKVITDVVHIGKDMGIERMDYAFMNQRNLTTLRKGIFDGLKDVRSFYFVFGILDNEEVPVPGEVLYTENTENQGLTTIPEQLFDHCQKVTDFGCAFFGCKIKTIPNRLFANNTQAKNFGATFSNTNIESIPSGLFDNNQLVENFSYTFFDCRNLKGPSPFAIYVNHTGKCVQVFMYNRDKHARYYRKPIMYKNCFTNCFGLEDYTNIPETWK